MSNAERIKRNARELRELYKHWRTGWGKSGPNPEHFAALETFQRSYDRLAFPGGLENALVQIQRGDPEVLETALTYLEVRPYYNQSQYVFTVLLRRVKRAHLSADQRARLDKVRAAITERKTLREERAAPGYVPCEQCGHERTYHRRREGCLFCNCLLNFDHLKAAPNRW